MSFMITECPWCGESYSFGVVGTTQIGSGHDCKATIRCASPGCAQDAAVHVAGWGDPDDQQFVCVEHIRGVVLDWQMRSASS